MNSHSHSDSDDTSTISNGPANWIAAACAKLRRRAFRATNKLSLARGRNIRRVARRVLCDIARCMDAVDVQLFRVALDESASGPMGLQYHTGFSYSDEGGATLRKFQFRLLPRRVQDCMLGNQIASIRGSSAAGGRILSSLLAELDCDTYYLCPLFVDRELKGILGVACRARVARESDAVDEFFELLKLNGTILLTNVLRVRREVKRNRKLKEWRHIANQACDFAMMVDERFVVRQTSAFGAGAKTPQLNGLRLTDIVSRGFHREVIRQIETAVENAEVRTIEFQINLGHRGPRWYVARIEPSRHTQTASATLYVTDNNPDKVLQEENRELTEQLVKASRLSLLGQMSTEFSHQLNQPLQAIMTYCNMMQRRIERGEATDEDDATTLAKIENSVDHCANIIQRIRDFVAFRSLLTEEVNVQELLDLAMMMVLPTARGWDADLVSPDDVPSLTVVVDRAQTTHVLVNLMINALEACRDFGRQRPHVELFVREETERGRVTIGVTDNGPGLPTDDPNVVFRKFYSGKQEGLGMGLTISRDVCESQGGSLTAGNNTEGPGCTFLVTMELQRESRNDTDELEVIDDENFSIE